MLNESGWQVVANQQHFKHYCKHAVDMRSGQMGSVSEAADPMQHLGNASCGLQARMQQ